MTSNIQNTTRKKREFNNDTKLFATLWILTLFLTVGVSLNLQAVISNEGGMPVQGSGQDTETHFYYTDPSEVNYYYLTDIMKLPVTKDRTLYFSIGDLLMVVSILFMAFTNIYYYKKEKIIWD